jgi:hypothetical protein
MARYSLAFLEAALYKLYVTPNCNLKKSLQLQVFFFLIEKGNNIFHFSGMAAQY